MVAKCERVQRTEVRQKEMMDALRIFIDGVSPKANIFRSPLGNKLPDGLRSNVHPYSHRNIS